jgi:hypothetical protein
MRCVGLIAIEGGGAHTGVLANTQCVCMVLQCVAHLFAPAAPLVAFVRAPTVSAATVVSTVVINSWLTHHRHDSLKTPGQIALGRLCLFQRQLPAGLPQPIKLGHSNTRTVRTSRTKRKAPGLLQRARVAGVQQTDGGRAHPRIIYYSMHAFRWAISRGPPSNLRGPEGATEGRPAARKPSAA